MGHESRQNPTAQQATAGVLMSRRSLMGAMDHALETHASALRLLEAKIVGLKDRVEKLEIMLNVPPVEALTREIVDATLKVDPIQTGYMTRPASGQPCGCDPGAGWICERHSEAAGHAHTD